MNLTDCIISIMALLAFTFGDHCCLPVNLAFKKTVFLSFKCSTNYFFTTAKATFSPNSFSKSVSSDFSFKKPLNFSAWNIYVLKLSIRFLASNNIDSG